MTAFIFEVLVLNPSPGKNLVQSTIPGDQPIVGPAIDPERRQKIAVMHDPVQGVQLLLRSSREVIQSGSSAKSIIWLTCVIDEWIEIPETLGAYLAPSRSAP